MNTNKKERNTDAFLKAFEKNGGNVSLACKAAGLSRSWYYKETKQSPDFNERVLEINDAIGDEVEDALMKQIKGGNPICIIFYCKTKLKHRGYVERQEIDHSGSLETSAPMALPAAKAAALAKILNDAQPADTSGDG